MSSARNITKWRQLFVGELAYDVNCDFPINEYGAPPFLTEVCLNRIGKNWQKAYGHLRRNFNKIKLNGGAIEE